MGEKITNGLSADTAYRARRVIANMASGSHEIEDSTTLDQLGFDSLDTVELGIKLQDAFGLDAGWNEADFTPSDTVAVVVGRVTRALARP